jgi:hypothetical protein
VKREETNEAKEYGRGQCQQDLQATLGSSNLMVLTQSINEKEMILDWGCGSVVEHLVLIPTHVHTHVHTIQSEVLCCGSRERTQTRSGSVTPDLHFQSSEAGNSKIKAPAGFISGHKMALCCRVLTPQEVEGRGRTNIVSSAGKSTEEKE